MGRAKIHGRPIRGPTKPRSGDGCGISDGGSYWTPMLIPRIPEVNRKPHAGWAVRGSHRAMRSCAGIAVSCYSMPFPGAPGRAVSGAAPRGR